MPTREYQCICGRFEYIQLRLLREWGLNRQRDNKYDIEAWVYHYIVVHRRRFNTIVAIYRRMKKKRKKKPSTTVSKLFVKSCEHILFLSPDKVSLFFCRYILRHPTPVQLSTLPRTLPLSNFDESAFLYIYKKREDVSHIPLLAKHDTELICDNKPALICRYVAEHSCSSIDPVK